MDANRHNNLLAETDGGYETRELGGPVYIAIGLVVLTLLTGGMTVVSWIGSRMEQRHADMGRADRLYVGESQKAAAFPEATMETRQAIEGRNRLLLESYGWISRESGVVRIPIDRAMELALERGFPVRAQDPK